MLAWQSGTRAFSLLERRILFDASDWLYMHLGAMSCVGLGHVCSRVCKQIFPSLPSVLNTATSGTIGHVDHGKTSLTAAITKVDLFYTR